MKVTIGTYNKFKRIAMGFSSMVFEAHLDFDQDINLVLVAAMVSHNDFGFCADLALRLQRLAGEKSQTGFVLCSSSHFVSVSFNGQDHNSLTAYEGA